MPVGMTIDQLAYSCFSHYVIGPMLVDRNNTSLISSFIQPSTLILYIAPVSLEIIILQTICSALFPG